MSTLKAKKCQPCHGGAPPLKIEEIEKLYSIAKFLKQKSKDIIKELKISIQYVYFPY